jgi:NitT/TauT family transport system substrate-binding protein
MQIRSMAMLLVIACLVFAGAPGGAQTAGTPIRIGTFASDLGAQALYAKDLGFFQRAGLDVDVSPAGNGPSILAAVAGGSLDIGWGNAISVAQAAQRGIPVTILAIAAVDDTTKPVTGLLAVPRNSPLSTGKDFNGKTIAMLSLGNISSASTKAWIDQNGGDSKTVHFIELPYSEMSDALRAGRIDGAIVDNTADPNIGKPNAVLRIITCVYAVVAPRIAGSVWYSTTDWVRAHPDAARKFIAVMHQTAEWAATHRPDSARLLAGYIHRSPDEIASMSRVAYATDLPPSLLQPELDLAFKYGLLSKSIDTHSLINPIAAAPESR